MIQPHRRSTVFRMAPHADLYIAEMQQAYASQQVSSDPVSRTTLSRLYDHLIPFNPRPSPFGPFGVLAFPAKTRQHHENLFPAAVERVLKTLGIARVALLDLTKTDLADFCFGSSGKRKRFHALAGRTKNVGGLLLDRAAVRRVLPLFFDARRWDVPIIFVISADPPALSFSLCDDGNLHYCCSKELEAPLLDAAAAAGLVAGDTKLCSTYSVVYLRNADPQ